MSIARRLKELLLFIALLGLLPAGAEPRGLHLLPEYRQSSSMPFLPHRDPYTLAVNLPNQPFADLTDQLRSALKLNLHRFTGWSSQGESHLTVITPPEFEVLSSCLTAEEIDLLATDLKLQEADIIALGIGSGTVPSQEGERQTYFLIVDSAKARAVRHAVHAAYVANGGDPADWDPTWYFPHVTLGFTHTDLHENQGVLKDIKHSWDRRVRLTIPPRLETWNGSSETD